MTDIADTVAPKSDQLNGDDLLGGPQVFTVAEVRVLDSAEQPVLIFLAEFPHSRPFKPSKTVRRILLAAWGKKSSEYVGRRMRLFRDDSVKFAGEAVGGIRVSHLSHIDRPITLSLNATRGKKSSHTVQPLPDDAPTAPPVDEGTVAKLAELRAEWKSADPERRAAIEAEVASLEAAAPQTGDPS